uniref:Helitron_like_N domain-containing protein n=1 Tax=Onchocerca ochengi TaxID=42157 RepID=A0A182EZD9_ONCOC
LNQTKLRSEEYIHLRDAVVNDGNTTNIGRLAILPSSYAGEYAQDAIPYVRQYGRPDLLITFMCNPAWDDKQNLLLPRQSTMDRHDITARVFRQKLKSLMNFMAKRSVRYWMYSLEWLKRGLPHAHILIWL